MRPPCTVTRQCGSAGASTAYHHQIITRSLHHHSQQIHVRSVRRLTLLTFSQRWIKLIKFDKLFIFVPPSPLPSLKRERERERAVGSSVLSEPARSQHSQRQAASVLLIPSKLFLLIDNKMNQSDFYKMQKLHFDREKHRGYWNIGERDAGLRGTGTQHGELGWAPGHDILFGS